MSCHQTLTDYPAIRLWKNDCGAVEIQWFVRLGQSKHVSRMLKKARLLTRPTPARLDAPFPKQGRSERSLIRGGWDDPNCAQLSHPPSHWHAETCPQPERGPSKSQYLYSGSGQAALYCAHRATTASSWGLCEQEGRLATPPHPSEAARCARRGDPSQPLRPFLSILLDRERLVLLKDL